MEISRTGFASIAFGYPNALWENLQPPFVGFTKWEFFAQDKKRVRKWKEIKLCLRTLCFVFARWLAVCELLGWSNITVLRKRDIFYISSLNIIVLCCAIFAWIEQDVFFAIPVSSDIQVPRYDERSYRDLPY